MKKLLSLFILALMPLLASANGTEISEFVSANADSKESLYGEWWLVGWNDGGITYKVDTSYVSKRHLTIEIPKEGYVMAYSMVNEIFVGLLTLNGNEMIFDGEMRRFMTEVYCDVMENVFFEGHICDIKFYQLEGKLLRLYYTDNDYFVFTKDFEWKNGAQTDYFYYYKGNKIPLTLNENKVVVSVPKDFGDITERVLANIPTLDKIFDESFDIFLIHQSDFNKLTMLDFWAEDSKSAILTSCYYTENNEEICTTPYLNVQLKKEEDIDMLTSYAEQYKLNIVKNSPLMPLWYILNITPDSEKNTLECANALYESGYFEASEPDFAYNVKIEEPYRPFVEDGKVWAVKVTTPETKKEWMEFYYLEGDTIVNDQKAKRMLCDRVFTTESENTYREYVGAFYEQDKKVYYAYDGNQQFRLLYDFTLSTGDIIPHSCMNIGEDVQVTKMSGGIPGFKGTYYILKAANYDGKVERWLEGVGSEYYPWLNVRGDLTGIYRILLACMIGDEIIYYNSEVDDAYIMGARKKRFDFTHTIKTKPKAPMRRGPEQSLYGEYNDMQLGINLDPLDDDYQVRITDETGKVVYDKAVNAGNIVGLNIDISTYAKGRYTVTVENSKETFTGEFDAQTTGIEKVISKAKEASGQIYNLQGQRLTTPPAKGIYIQNGRKIIVK